MNIGNLIEGRASSDIISVEVGQSVREAVRILASKRIGALPVLEQGRVAGIFSERDVIHRLADEGEACLDRRVGEVMTSPAITVDRMTTIDDALGLSDTEFARELLALYNVTVLPGSYLAREAQGSNPGAQRVRMALVAEAEECVEAALRIVQFIQSRTARQ